MRRLLFLLALSTVFSVQSTPIPFEQRIPSPDIGRGFTGRANFTGEVLVPTCSLVMDNNWQIIEVGENELNNRELGAFLGSKKRILLKLSNCDFSGTGTAFYTASWMNVAFEGQPGGGRDRFSLSGLAKGMDLQIFDKNGRVVLVNTIMPKVLVDVTDQGLAYTVRLVRNGDLLQIGNYYGALRFKVNYE